MEKANEQLNDILSGKIKADNALPDVQTWLKLTVYNMAHAVATTSTKQGRKEQLQTIKQSNPLFYDDVAALARVLYEKLQTTI